MIFREDLRKKYGSWCGARAEFVFIALYNRLAMQKKEVRNAYMSLLTKNKIL